MSKSSVYKDTSGILSAAFPFLLKGLKEISDAIPTPAGSVVKGVVQATIFLMERAEQYKSSKDDIYLLSARSAQVVTVIVNDHQRSKRDLPPDDNLRGIKSVIEEISSWIHEKTVPAKRSERILGFLKSDDVIKEVRGFNEKLDNAISRFGLQSQITSQKSLSAIQESIDGTKDLVTGLVADVKNDLKRMEIKRLLEKSRVETLLSTDSRCLPGTRESILHEIDVWLDAPQSTSGATSPSIYWLKGVAGCGKSTVSRSVKDLAAAKNITCSCFYFSRDFEDRRRLDKLMTTVAVDLVSSEDKNLVEKIYRAVTDDKVSGSSPLAQQVRGFFKDPLHVASRPVVLIWDALDECTEPNSRRALFDLLGSLPRLPPSIKIFLTSRYEADLEIVRKRMGRKVRCHDLTFDRDSKDDFTTHDITAYISYHSDRMSQVGKDWLGVDVVPKLVALADGLFMAADFICSFIDHPNGEDRLASLLAQARYDCGGSTTDSLYRWYHTGLEHIFDQDGPIEVQHARNVMGMILVAQHPLPATALAILLELEEKYVAKILDRLSPFLVLAQGRTGVRFVHKSMSDFFESGEAGRFHIDKVFASAHVAIPCLQILQDQISEAFKSPVPLTTSGSITKSGYVPNVSVVLNYACLFWGYHLKDVTNWENVKELLHTIFFNHLLEWMHVMGHLDALDLAISSLMFIGNWKLASENSDILKLVRDCIFFLQEFHYPLRTYRTMKSPWLHFTPTNTLLHQVYSPKRIAPVDIMKGIPYDWLPLQMTIREHGGWVTSVAFSPDGKHIVSGSHDKTVQMWNALTGQPFGPPMKGHIDWVTSVAYSPDGRYIISGSCDNTVHVWNALTGQSLGPPLKGHRSWVTSVAASPDGKHIVSGSVDKTIYIWNMITGQPLQPPLKGHRDCVTSVAFSPDGKSIVSGSYDKTVCLWSMPTGEPLGSPLKGHMDWVTSVAFSPDGKHIVSGSADKTLCTWDAQTNQSIGSPLEGHIDCVTSVAFSPDGKHIVSGSVDNMVHIWNALTGQQLRLSLEGHSDRITSVAFSPDGKNIVSGSADKTVRIWNALTAQHLGLPLKGHRDSVTSVAFSPDGKHIVTGSSDKTVQIWDAFTGQSIGPPLEGHRDFVTSVAYSPDGKHIVSGSYDKTICIWHAHTGHPVQSPLDGHRDCVTAVAFSPDGKHIVSSSLDDRLHIWNVLTGKPLGPPLEDHSDKFYSVAFSPNGKYMVSAVGNTVYIWDAHTGQPLDPPLEGHTHLVSSVGFSPDGKNIVSGSHDKTVCIWDVITGQCLSVLKGHNHWVSSVAFSPDGKHIISGSFDKTVRIWNVLTGKVIGPPLEAHSDCITSVAFSPDGKYIVSGSYDKRICIWNVLTNQPVGSLLEGHKGWVTSVTFSSDGKQVVSGSIDMTVCVWDVLTSQLLGKPLKGHRNCVTSVAFSPDGKYVASGSYDKTICIWNVATGQPIGSSLEGHRKCVTSVTFSPDGKHIVSGSLDKTMRIWNAITGQPLGSTQEGNRSWVTSITFTPDGKYVISVTVDKTMHIWNVFTRQLLKAKEYNKINIPSPKTLPFILSTNGWLTSTDDQQQICWLPNHSPVTTLAWSEISRCFVAGYQSGHIIMIKIA